MVGKTVGGKGGKTAPRTKFVRSDARPMLGVGTDTTDKRSLDQHVAAAAADIAEAIAQAKKDGGFQTRDYGIASTLHGLWIKDGSESHYETNLMNTNQLYAVVSDYHNRGFRPIDVMGSGRFMEPWSVAFAPRRDTGYYWQVGTNDADFKAKDMELFNAGFRVNSFNIRRGAFNATWGWTGAKTEFQVTRWNMDWFGLLAWDQHFKSEGHRIETVDRYGDGGTLYAATWRPGEGEQILEAPGGLNTYFGQPDKFLVHKYERQGLEVHAMGHNGYAVAAYRLKRGNYHQEWTYNTASAFKGYDASCRQDGYRMSFLSHAPWQIG